MKARVCVTTMGKRESPTFGGRDRQRKFFFFFLVKRICFFSIHSYAPIVHANSFLGPLSLYPLFFTRFG